MISLIEERQSAFFLGAKLKLFLAAFFVLHLMALDVAMVQDDGNNSEVIFSNDARASYRHVLILGGFRFDGC